MDEKNVARAEETGSQQAPPAASVDMGRRLPGTTVAVMIFILLVAFACAGVQVVVSMVEANNAPEEIKGKGETQEVEYPTLSRLPEGVAAEVNGVEIPESQVTSFIMSMRNKLGLEDQEAWDEWMIESGNTTETIRNRIIMYYLNNELIDQIADELDVHPSPEDYQATRDELYATPESTEAIEQLLAMEGRTLEDYESDIVTMTKRRMIGEKYNEPTLSSPEFKEVVLATIQANNPEYAEAQSLDEVDEAIVEQVSAQLTEVSNEQAFANYVREFIERSDIFYSKMGEDLPYKSNSDAHFMKEQFEYMLKKNGIVFGDEEDDDASEDGEADAAPQE